MLVTRNAIAKLLLVASVLVPFTELRIGPIGLGEVAILIAFLLMIHFGSGRLGASQLFFVPRFWLLFILASCMGFFYNFFILYQSSGSVEGAAFDLTAYSFVLVFCLLASKQENFGKAGPASFFQRLYLLWFVVFSSLFLVSLSTPTIFGLPLRTYTAFTPLVSNVHQTAMLLCALPFLGVFFLTKSRSIYSKIWIAASIPLFGFMALSTQATKATMAIIIGSLVFVAWLLVFRPKGRGRSILNLILIPSFFLTLIVILAMNYGAVAASAIDFFHEADPQQAREIIYSDAFEHAVHSLLVGYGPGPQVLYGGKYWDAHMTFLTVFLQAGLVGLALFLILAAQVVRTIYWSPALLACFTAIAIYALGGDILRRLPIWILVMGLATLGQGLSPRTIKARLLSPSQT